MKLTAIYSQDAKLLGWFPQSFDNIGQRVFQIVQTSPYDDKFDPSGTVEGFLKVISFTRCVIPFRDGADSMRLNLYVVSQGTKEHLLTDITFIPLTAEMMS